MPHPTSIVTGATSGIGRWIARGLAQAGHHVLLVGRDSQRLAATQAWITQACPNALLTLEIADLSLLRDTRALAGRIGARHPDIALLVNNAGLFAPRRSETAEGHEGVIALNHLSPFVLTRALLPALSAGGAGRIVNIGSSISDHARIDPDDLEGRRRWGMVHAYGQSKLALMMATFGWAKRLPPCITANVVHPGAVATRLVRAGGPIGLAWRLMAPFLLNAEQGAETPLHVALSPALAGVTGTYFKRRQPARPNKLALQETLLAQVWEATTDLTRET